MDNPGEMEVVTLGPLINLALAYLKEPQMAVAISDEIILKKYEAHAFIETKSEQTYGQFVIDQHHLLRKSVNVTICEEVDAKRFKELLFKNII